MLDSQVTTLTLQTVGGNLLHDLGNSDSNRMVEVFQESLEVIDFSISADHAPLND